MADRGELGLLRRGSGDNEPGHDEAEAPALTMTASPLGDAAHIVDAPADPVIPGQIIEPGRGLALTDLALPSLGAGERLVRLAYRLGVPGGILRLAERRAQDATRYPQAIGQPDQPLARAQRRQSEIGERQSAAGFDDLAGSDRIGRGIDDMRGIAQRRSGHRQRGRFGLVMTRLIVTGTATFRGGPDCYASNIAALKGVA